ncbi:MAG: hypothetical protein ACE5GX_07085 [Thermoanaerobaculia bacterium]
MKHFQQVAAAGAAVLSLALAAALGAQTPVPETLQVGDRTVWVAAEIASTDGVPHWELFDPEVRSELESLLLAVERSQRRDPLAREGCISVHHTVEDRDPPESLEELMSRSNGFYSGVLAASKPGFYHDIPGTLFRMESLPTSESRESLRLPEEFYVFVRAGGFEFAGKSFCGGNERLAEIRPQDRVLFFKDNRTVVDGGVFEPREDFLICETGPDSVSFPRGLGLNNPSGTTPVGFDSLLQLMDRLRAEKRGGEKP